MFDFDQMVFLENQKAHEQFARELKHKDLNNVDEARKLYLSFIEGIYPEIIRDMVRDCYSQWVGRFSANAVFEGELDHPLENVFLAKKLGFRFYETKDKTNINYVDSCVNVYANESVMQEFFKKYMSAFCQKHNLGYYFKTEGFPFKMTLDGHYKDLKELYASEMQELSAVYGEDTHITKQ